jgi:IS30 family transposase
MWYCYLEQDHIDSSFYKLEDPIRGQKSKDVMRFILGHYTEILNDLEITLDNVSQEKSGMADSIKNFRKTLKEFGYDDGGQIYDEIGRAKSDIGSELKKMEELRTDYKAKTHFVDRLRDKLRECSEYVAKQQEIAFDLKQKIKEQEALIAELMATKFKLARTKHSSEILSSIQFKKCPACGKSIRLVRHGEADCHLCGIPHSTEEPQKSLDVEVINKDLDSRQDDLETSINGHKKALKRHEQIVQEAIAQKGSLEVRLRDELKNYDSNFLSDSREAERNLATLEERIRGLERLAKIPNIIQGLEADLVKKFVEEKSLKEKIESEKKKLNVFAYVEEIQNEFLAFLLKVGLPGVSADDKVLINHVTWVPSVLTGGAIGLRWSFFNAGSGGKKTLFNACYALALHVVTSANDMPLPGFLIIDTPMKNIGEEVNKSIFVNFYNLVYDLSVGPLKDTQIILVDKEYIKPTVDGVEIKEKYMTPDDEEYPPLISYYRGP